MYRRKIFTAIALLCVCAVLLVAVSYAWISLSLAPEILGVHTQVCANGSLEIALLSDTTYLDPSGIRAAVGSSEVVQEAYVSNLSWGNIVDLSGDGYGLGKVSLSPARLAVSVNDQGQGFVRDSFLSVPQFGTDGRAEDFREDLASAVYGDNGFLFSAARQSYGVRAIGTLSGMTLQQQVLSAARGGLRARMSSAAISAKAVWTEYGAEIVNILLQHYYLPQEAYSAADFLSLRAALSRLQSAVSDICLGYRQAVLGYAATVVEDPELFSQLYGMLNSSAVPLSAVLTSVPVAMPEGLLSQVRAVENSAATIAQTLAASTSAPESVSWQALEPMVSCLVTAERVYMNESLLSTPAAYSGMTADNMLSLMPQGGYLADTADYIGNWNTFFAYDVQTNVEVRTYSPVQTPYLEQLALLLEGSAAGSGSSSESDLEDIYGFAADLAFRCNQSSQLLLQTFPQERLQMEESLEAFTGNGSYMEFSSGQLSESQMVNLMDALRIAFLDSQYRILGVAKLNTSNYSAEGGVVSAPLYLYDFTCDAAGTIRLGERMAENSPITQLCQNTPEVLTVVVWLDGDYVSNNHAAIGRQSMTGKLNLQFSSSADLTGAAITPELD